MCSCETLNKMKKMIGCAIIRTAPTRSAGDYSCSSSPILLLGFTKSGAIRYQYLGVHRKILGGHIRTLPLDFTDDNWILYEEAFIEDSTNPLNKFKGKKIHRICPSTNECSHDRSYMDNPIELVVASQNHIIFRDLEGSLNIVNLRLSNPDEWALA